MTKQRKPRRGPGSYTTEERMRMHDESAANQASNLVTTAINYMRDEMGHTDARIVEQIVRECEALVLFDNDLCLLLQSYGWENDKWEVMDETDREDYERNK